LRWFYLENARRAWNVSDRSKFYVMLATNDTRCSNAESKLTEFLFRRMAIDIESNNNLIHTVVQIINHVSPFRSNLSFLHQNTLKLQFYHLPKFGGETPTTKQN